MKLVTAESCTGGMIGAVVTDIAGSSDVFEQGFITYSNDAKISALGVAAATLEQFGAVSEQTAREMALGALKNSRADIVVAVTGVAGPDGGSAEKPVGTVYIAWGDRARIECMAHHFDGDRGTVRRATVEAALKHVVDFLEAQK